MKRILYVAIFIASVIDGYSQSSNQNYVKTRTYIKTGTEYIDNIKYFDGFGRLVETLQKGVTPSNNDLVTHTEYDGTGREFRQWLPVSIAGNNGQYVDINTFKDKSLMMYSNLSNDEFPYAESIYESSPLNRVLGKRNPGRDWNDHPTQMEYGANDGTIAYFYVTDGGVLYRDGNYLPNMLYKTILVDEDGKDITEYKNKIGQTVMKRNGENTDTYYVYNYLGQLEYVLPPLACDAMIQSTYYYDNFSAIEKYAYVYKYDNRGNCISKRLPGCEPIYMTYDRACRLILSQDGNQRSSLNKPVQYTVNKYDILGRVLYTGVINREVSQSEKDFIQNNVIIESYGTSNQLTNTGYTCNTFANEIIPMVVNYYDNYKFLELPEADSYLRYVGDDAFSEAYMSDYPSGDLNGLNARGLLTGTRTYLLDGSGDYTMSVMYYNNKGKVVQTSSSNHLGGHDIVYNTLDFTGNPTMTRKEHNIAGQPVKTELYTYSYDHASRLLETSYVLGSDNPVVLTSNTYDELGRLKLKTRHNSIDTEVFDYNIRSWFTRIKSGDFEENIYYNNLPIDVIEATPFYNGNISYSSWTYGDTKNAYQYNYDTLNRFVGGYCYINNVLQDRAQYSESVNYDKMGNISQLNRYDSGGVVDQLTLSYEGNQLKSVSDNGFAPSQYGIKEYQDKSSSNDEYAYDKNGNMIKDLDRDIVCIRYNILNLPDTVQFKNGHQIINKYDASGKKLSDEYYTLLYGVQVPIAVGKVLNIKNSYSPDEVDLIKKHYVDNFTYNWHIMNQSSGEYDLEKVYNTEGYVDNISLSNRYNYFRKDHLGTNREVWCASFKENDKIYPANTIQRTQYYPSGLPWADGTGTAVQNKKYNGKEWIEAHGYDMYDYGARGYYPAIMRFTSLDPLAEKHPEISPYVFCSNNPVNRVDPDGRSDYNFSKEGKLDKYVANDKPDRIMVESGKNDSGEKAYTTLDADGVKQFLAIVVGEATNNKDEATGIANVMLNRMDYNDVDLKSGFVDKIGGKKDFDAIDGKQYNKVMGQSLKETLDSNVGVRVEGAMSALSPLTGDNTNGAFFWNATSQKNAKNPGWNWTQYDKKVYSKTAEKGGTTFFKYNPNKSENPKHYKNVWP